MTVTSILDCEDCIHYKKDIIDCEPCNDCYGFEHYKDIKTNLTLGEINISNKN